MPAITLGQDPRNGAWISLSEEARRQGTYVLGVTGTGKSNLLKLIAWQDIGKGDGLCFLDPHGDVIWEILASIPPYRRKDVIIFDPADINFPFGLNMFELEDTTNPLAVDRVCSEVVITLRKLWADMWGPRMEDIIRHTVLTIMATPDRTMLDMLPVLTDDERRKDYLKRVTDPVILHYWDKRFPRRQSTQDEWVSSTLNKLGRFLTNPVIRNIVCQPKSSFDFRKVMDEGKILLVNLSKGQLGEDNSALLGAVLIGKILMAALSRSEIPVASRRRFHLVVDEYQSFATESFPTLQSEARKYGIDTVVAHQYRAQLDRVNLGSTLNVGNFIFLRTSGPDASELALQFDNTPPPGESVLKHLPYRTGREGIYRTNGDEVLDEGQRRPYGDIERETANFLANTPNYHAYCRFVDGKGMAEYFVEICDSDVLTEKETGIEDMKAQSRALARPREEVERMIASFWSGDGNENNGSPDDTGRTGYEM